MKIKNYTTTIDAAKSIFEIEKMLSDSKATHIMKTYRGDGKIEALFFNISNVGYKLPANVEKVKVALKNSKSCSYSKLDDQSERVAWRVIRDWLRCL
jgi:DNA-binding winged helix-turn-helix (wHTH) protein